MPANDLDEIHQLIAPGRSAWERLVHLRRAWKQVRGLSARERQDLAIKLGLEKGSDALDKLIEAHPERAPTKQALRAIREVDPSAVRAIALNLTTSEPAQRKAMLESAANTLVDRVMVPIEEQPLALPALPPPSSAIETSAAPMPTVPEQVIRTAAPVIAEAIRVPPEPASPSVVAVADEPHVTDEQITALATLPLLRRFYALRFHVDGVASSDDARRVLRAFPDGWARRRAFLALLDEGVPMDGTVIEEISVKADRRWCERALSACTSAR